MALMMLLTKANRKALPKLYETEGVPVWDKVVQVKFFDPCGSFTWYAVEFDGEDRFFGLVDGLELEWGYFSLSELNAHKGRLGIGIERDRHFPPQKIRDIQNAKLLAKILSWKERIKVNGEVMVLTGAEDKGAVLLGYAAGAELGDGESASDPPVRIDLSDSTLVLEEVA